jgi:hypothetical protein
MNNLTRSATKNFAKAKSKENSANQKSSFSGSNSKSNPIQHENTDNFSPKAFSPLEKEEGTPTEERLPFMSTLMKEEKEEFRAFEDGRVSRIEFQKL